MSTRRCGPPRVNSAVSGLTDAEHGDAHCDVGAASGEAGPGMACAGVDPGLVVAGEACLSSEDEGVSGGQGEVGAGVTVVAGVAQPDGAPVTEAEGYGQVADALLLNVLGLLLAGLPAGEEVHEVAEALDHAGVEGPSGLRNDTTAPGWEVPVTPSGVTVSSISSPVTGQAEVTRAGCPVQLAQRAGRPSGPAGDAAAGEPGQIGQVGHGIP